MTETYYPFCTEDIGVIKCQCKGNFNAMVTRREDIQLKERTFEATWNLKKPGSLRDVRIFTKVTLQSS